MQVKQRLALKILEIVTCADLIDYRGFVSELIHIMSLIIGK